MNALYVMRPNMQLESNGCKSDDPLCEIADFIYDNKRSLDWHVPKIIFPTTSRTLVRLDCYLLDNYLQLVSDTFRRAVDLTFPGGTNFLQCIDGETSSWWIMFPQFLDRALFHDLPTDIPVDYCIANELSLLRAPTSSQIDVMRLPSFPTTIIVSSRFKAFVNARSFSGFEFHDAYKYTTMHAVFGYEYPWHL